MARVQYIVREEEDIADVSSMGATRTYAEPTAFAAGATVTSGGLTISKGGITVTSGTAALSGGATTTTASAGDSSTKVATTAFVQQAISAAIAAL